MKRKKIAGRGQKPPVVATILTVLLVIAVLSTPMAVSKYVATGLGSAKARTAAFRTRFTQVTAGYTTESTNPNGTNFAVHRSASGYKTAIDIPKFYWESESEVTVRATAVPCYVPRPYGAKGTNAAMGHQLHGLTNYQVGEYYDYSTPTKGYKDIPPQGIAMTDYGWNGTYYQLRWLNYQSPDTLANRSARAFGNLTGGVDITPGTNFSPKNGSIIPPNTSGGYLISTFINVYDTAPPLPPNQINVTGTSYYTMNGYWRSYRIVNDLRMEQVD